MNESAVVLGAVAAVDAEDVAVVDVVAVTIGVVVEVVAVATSADFWKNERLKRDRFSIRSPRPMGLDSVQEKEKRK